MIDELINTYTDVGFWQEVNVAVTAALILGLSGFLLRKYGALTLTKVLSIITFGNERIKRRIYQRISSLHHSGYGEFLSFVTLNAAVTALTIIFFTLNYSFGMEKLRDISIEIESAENGIWDSLEYQPTRKHDSEFELLDGLDIQNTEVSDLTNVAKDSIFKVRAGMLIILLYILYRYFTLSYVNAAQVYFKKTIDLCGPYITYKEKLTYISNFTRIECKEDYEKIINEIRVILKEHDIPLPAFVIW